MKVRDLIDILLDACELGDDVVMVKGKEKNHDKFNADYSYDIEWSTDRGLFYLFADFEGEEG